MSNKTTSIDDLDAFIRDIESRHFRTKHDTGANNNTLFVWNIVRARAGLRPLTLSDLPSYCTKHFRYHLIRADYGCEEAQ